MTFRLIKKVKQVSKVSSKERTLSVTSIPFLFEM